MSDLPRPKPDHAHHFYFVYIDQVPDGDVFEVLRTGVAETRTVLAGLGEDRELHRYAPGKWTVRDVVGHVVDTERVFGFRAFHIARGDRADLPGMDQDAFADAARASDRPVADWLDELEALRRSHLRLFSSFGEVEWSRVGKASGFPFRVSAFPWIMAGHEIHHRRVLAEKYG